MTDAGWRPEGLAPPFDLLRLPVAGKLLSRPGTRTAARFLLLVLAMAMVLHGWFGSQLAPKNLSTLLTWVHYRGLLVLGLLVAGNVFCYACPMMLARDAVRRIFHPAWRWPRRLQNKWLVGILFAAVLFVYELLDLWSDPWLTAWLIAGYFGAAVVVDTLFRGGSFCKYLCPVGQFNFLASTVSPLEVAVRDHQVCPGCAGKDCIRGAPAKPMRAARRGCELKLFQPYKVGNLDCTFCLDCVYACPHDNVGILARVPASELDDPRSRSGIGRIAGRNDLAFLTVLFVFGALLNVFGMVSPIYALEQWLANLTGIRIEAPILGTIFFVALLVEPLFLLGMAAWSYRRLTGIPDTLPRIARRYVYTLVPFGFGVWLSHYSFHFLTGVLTFLPVLQSLLASAGVPLLGLPDWSVGGLQPESALPIEIGFLGLGFILTVAVTWRIAVADAPARPLRAFAPWLALQTILLCAVGWLLSLPMQMRGTFLG